MSSRNFFIIKKVDESKSSGLEEIAIDLIKFAIHRNIGITFNIRGYHDVILSLLNVTRDYFCVSDNFIFPESDELFSDYDCYLKIKDLPSEQAKIKEKELLLEKFSFLNDIVNMLFKQSNIKAVDFYVSDQDTGLLDDYDEIEVQDENLTGAFLDMLKPTKRENMFGLKTTKFIINKKF